MAAVYEALYIARLAPPWQGQYHRPRRLVSVYARGGLAPADAADRLVGTVEWDALPPDLQAQHQARLAAAVLAP